MNTATMGTGQEERRTDRELLLGWSKGDARARGTLSRRFHGLLRQFFANKNCSDDVDDLSQQVWVALGETLQRQDVSQIRTSVRGYLLGIARHVLFAHLRKKYREANLDPLSSTIAALDSSLSQAVGKKLQAQRMTLALQRLPLDTQILLEMRYVHDMTTAEIAVMYCIPEGTVKSRLSRARGLLDEALMNDKR